jgi:hypothetical protein
VNFSFFFTIFGNGSLKEPLLNGCVDFSYILFTLFINDFDQITVVKYLFYSLALTNLSPPIIFVPTNCQIFSITPFVHVNPTIKKLKLKNKNPWITNSLSSVFIHKKRDEKQRKKEEKNKRDRRNKNRNPTISTLTNHNF